MASIPKSLVRKAARPADLPDFERPPLVEVVLGVQFSELRNYRTQHAGLLWGTWFRDQFPICREQPPLSAVFETFGSAMPRQLGMQLEVHTVPGPTVPRLWFIKEDNSELVQVQADRFVHNWKRSKEDAEYPRYEPIREKFFTELANVEEFLKREAIGALEPNQCEVTYVNHIELDDNSDPRSQLHRILVFHKAINGDGDQSDSNPPKMEEGRLSLRFIVCDPKNGEPRCRLHVEAQPATVGEDRPIIRLSLTARGSPISPTFQGVADTLDLGRDAVVRAFTRLTTSEMHKSWGRMQ